jgi:adenine phosphoribosyltransferase
LEYGKDILEMHTDAINPGDKVIIHDDLLATGGTAKAATELVLELGGQVVGYSFIIELSFLSGKNQLLKEIPSHSIIQY